MTTPDWTKKHGGLSQLLDRPELQPPPGWQPTGQNPETERPWAWDLAFDRWLDSLGTDTRRRYRNHWKEFLGKNHKLPWQIEPFDIERWTWFLELGNASATINSRLRALSSFYEFVIANCTYPTPSGHQIPLHPVNPVPPRRWPKRQPHASQPVLTPSEVWVLFESIDPCTPLGSRDYALYLTFLGAGKPNRHVRLLRCGDLKHEGGRALCCWPRQGWQPLPAGVWLAIQEYIACAKDLLAMQPDDYLFTPLEDITGRLDQIGPPDWRRHRSLSKDSIAKSLNIYAQAAHLDPARITVQSLRYAGALIRLHAGASLPDLAAFLGHTHLKSTRRFLAWVNQHPLQDWSTVRSGLGLD
jgi:site-specific recombinase XerD